ncbi:Protein tesmin/TSO1-like CXC 5 [Datura stramonium]|uniref:Protein tesmin/TSO1-like CXC 5 n=1 Tax=Datura stramonium TaxID=4076 RepID=A0ABS8UYJ0_DATST|nr:Protein tesmin/TSO1-like CXC 5 [Datura stramonium]
MPRTDVTLFERRKTNRMNVQLDEDDEDQDRAIFQTRVEMYCECFSSGIYCDGCNCFNCLNNVDNEAARREAVEATLERNPNAFRPKIASSPHGAREKRVFF